jgi:hypothetical protein
MSDHASPEPHGQEAAVLPAGDGMRFEKAELDYFVDDDRDTGRKIGVMLAFIFCFLILFMSGVAWWTGRHESVGDDPFEGIPTPTTPKAGH